MAKTYRLKKCRQILHNSYSWYQKKGKNLSAPVRNQLENNLKSLENAIFANNREEASLHAKKVEELTHEHFKKSPLQYAMEIGVAIVFALLIATVVRQMWFELYEIPTGSMRPSFREQDRLTVTKTAFGLNVPMETKHFIFDPSLTKRGRVFIFSGDNIPSLDETTTYFGLFPYTKRYIKRLIGKPGDSLYFYGGNIYGVDKDGNPLDVLLEDPWMKKLEHVPFINFTGEYSNPREDTILFKHMDQPVGRLIFNRIGTHRGEIYRKGRWVKEKPFSGNRDEITSLGDFWGMGNFAMARLLDREDLKNLTALDPKEVGEAELYLQLRHSPNLTYPPPRLYKDGRYVGVQIPSFESVIPLRQEHIEAIRDNLYTSRFVIKDGRARLYSVNNKQFFAGSPRFSDVPDGTYEFVRGKAEKVGFKGWTSDLPSDHPLNNLSNERIKELYNMGIEMMSAYEPYTFFQVYYPHRYAYWRDGDLYLLSAPVLKQGDPALEAFIKEEQSREKKASSSEPYKAFVDRGPPLKDGKIDVEFVKTFGIKIPPKHYLALGDNHAMSKDSRIFGFVPQNNIQGAPSLLIWPPGPRWGWPPQTPYPFITVPRLIVWAIAAAILLVWYLYHRRKMSRRLFPEENNKVPPVEARNKNG